MLIALAGCLLWIVCLAQLIYLPIWASSLGRSGALWCLINILWSGGWIAGGWMVGTLFLYGSSIGGEGFEGAALLYVILPSLCSLLPSLALAVAGRASGPPLRRRRGIRPARRRSVLRARLPRH